MGRWTRSCRWSWAPNVDVWLQQCGPLVDDEGLGAAADGKAAVRRYAVSLSNGPWPGEASQRRFGIAVACFCLGVGVLFGTGAVFRQEVIAGDTPLGVTFLVLAALAALIAGWLDVSFGFVRHQKNLEVALAGAALHHSARFPPFVHRASTLQLAWILPMSLAVLLLRAPWQGTALILLLAAFVAFVFLRTAREKAAGETALSQLGETAMPAT